MILVSVILTGMVLALAWAGSLHTQMASQIPKIDAAYYAAEAGIQHAVWKFRHDNQWRATAANPLKGSLAMYDTTWNYEVTCTDNVGDATLAWKLDEATGMASADATGHSNIGVFHGGVSWDSPGRSGACIKLDGINGYIDCGNNSSTNLTGDMTFSAWIKMNSAYYDQKIGGNQDGDHGGYKLCIYNSKVEFEVRDANNKPHLNRDITGGTILTMGSWYHVVGVYSASGHWIKTYVNGKLDRTLIGDGTGTGLNDVPVNALGSTTGNFVMGREPWDASLYYFNGWLDDIRIYNRTLTDAEIKSLFDTTVDIKATVKGGNGGGTVSNNLAAFCSIPTPPAPTNPASLSGKDLDLKNCQINGDVNVIGGVSSAPGSSTIEGDLRYTGSYSNGPLTVKGDKTKVSTGDIKLPNISYSSLRSQAAQTVNGNSKDQTFSFNSLGGNKVIWIKGDLENPNVTIGGTYAAGGTFVVDGKVKFTGGATTLGLPGYPVYIVADDEISHSGGKLTLTGALYTQKKFKHKNVDITGTVYAKDGVENTSSAMCAFTASAIPWMDQRATNQQSATLPVYTSNYRGIGP
jgi:hypothetical protein